MGWWKNSVIYEIMPKSFYDSNGDGWGDLRGVIKKLDYLKELGINAIWFTPFWESGGKDNGYDIANYKKVELSYGNNRDLKDLIKECKKRDIKVIFDMVMSHTSSRHEWFVESRKDKKNRYRDWYIWRRNTNKEGLYSIYEHDPWEFDPNTMESYFHLFSRDMPDLNYSNPKVRKYFQELIKHYISLGVSGFRFDVIDVIAKDIDKGVVSEGEKLLDFIYEIASKGWNNSQKIMTVGEGWNMTAEKAKKYAGFHNKGLSMVFWLKQILTQEEDDMSVFREKEIDFDKIKNILYKWQKSTEGTSWNALFLNNHDTGRVATRWASKKYRDQSIKTIATTMYTMKGTPFIYQGEEIGMTNSDLKNISDFPCVQAQGKYYELVVKNKEMTDEEFTNGYLKIDARDNSKTPVQWDETKNAGFTNGKTTWLKVNDNYKSINVKDQEKDKTSILNHYKKLISFKNKDKETMDIFLNGRFEENKSEKAVFDFSILHNNKEIRTIANWTNKSISIPLVEGKILIKSNSKFSNGNLGPWESIVFLK